MKKFSLCIALAAFSAFAQEHAPLTAEQILKKVTYPEEFEATVFASPTNISYPIFISAAPDGTLFVGCDENGSLDRKPDRGRVVMCQDTDGDGKADKFTVFAKMDSPRGVAWDASTRTLYVMHPPFLTAYHDEGNTGASTRQEDLISGLGFDLTFRGADHTINGIRLGIDGWIYIACGDYGAVKAVGKDGRSLSLRGGGIVRIRPDGTGLEQVVWGTRNILAVAISPTMELFTRDNTNDGDDWNDRLSFNPFGAQMGYPTLFRNFPDEMIPTMIDFGGGSPVGSIFIDEPDLPKKWSHGFYSVEWGRNEIDLHPLTQTGGTWKAETSNFMKMVRATDLEVDALGHIYAASWDGATFTYAGPNVGYIIRLSPKDAKPALLPDFKKLSEAQLVEMVGSPSAVRRQAAQRELLSRGPSASATPGLERILAGNANNIGARVAAIFTLKQMFGLQSHATLVRYLSDDTVREYILKALGDDQRIASDVPSSLFTPSLADPNPRVRLQAETALGHLGKTDAAESILSRTADKDYTVAHIAVQALRWLKASDVCLRALDSNDEKLRSGALRVLQSLYQTDVVEGLLKRISTPNSELRQGIYKALARLDMQEAPYTNPSMWWGTRPDTSGPIYKPERWEQSPNIESALRQYLTGAQGEEAKIFVTALLRTKVSFPGFEDVMLSKSGSDAASRLEVMASLISPKTPTPEAVVKGLVAISSSPSELPDSRVRAFRLLLSMLEKNYSAARDAFVSLAGKEQEGPLASVWEEFTRDGRLARHVSDFASFARDTDPSKRMLGDTVLVNLITSTVVKDQRSKNSAQNAIDRLWRDPAETATLLEAIGRTRATQFAPETRLQLSSTNSDVVKAAQFALAKLGLDKPDPNRKTIAEIGYEEVVRAALQIPGDAKIGQELFLKQGCVVCHTTSEKDPPKGPMLGGIATRYSRAELCESILKPSAKIAQGFESQNFTLKNGDQVEGFVVKEGGDSVEVRNIVGATTILEKSDIAKREKRDQSIMPEGLVANITPDDLASLLAFLSSTTSK